MKKVNYKFKNNKSILDEKLSKVLQIDNSSNFQFKLEILVVLFYFKIYQKYKFFNFTIL